MKIAAVLATVTLAAGFASPTRAEVWAYVDDKGIPHFASDKLDERYELFFRGPGDTADRLGTPRAVAVPTAAPKLIAFFEVSPAYKRVRHHVRAASRDQNVDQELLKALIATESGFDASAVSPRGAIGLMQVMPTTAEYLGLKADANTPIEKKLADPAVNIKIGTKYLRYLMDRFPGQLELALAAYNAGAGAVMRAGRQIPEYRETQDYVKTVMQLYAMLKPPAALAARGNAPDRVYIQFPAPAPAALPVAAVEPRHYHAPFD